MPRFRSRQLGVFHVTINTNDGISWLTLPNIPRILLDNLVITKNNYHARIYAFCILSNHMHIILSPGKKGLSRFMQSFKSNSLKAARKSLGYHPDILRNVRRGAGWVKHYLERAGRGALKPGPGVPATGSITLRNIHWQNGFYDSRIECSYQSAATLSYVRNNALNHNLVTDPLAWPWSSLRFPELTDAMEPWLD